MTLSQLRHQKSPDTAGPPLRARVANRTAVRGPTGRSVPPGAGASPAAGARARCPRPPPSPPPAGRRIAGWPPSPATESGHRVWSDHNCSATRPSRVSQSSGRAGPAEADRGRLRRPGCGVGGGEAATRSRTDSVAADTGSRTCATAGPSRTRTTTRASIASRVPSTAGGDHPVSSTASICCAAPGAAARIPGAQQHGAAAVAAARPTSWSARVRPQWRRPRRSPRAQ